MESEASLAAVIDQFRADLAVADSLGKVDACMVAAFKRLPYWAVKQNGIVLHECEAKLVALRRGGKS